MDKNQIIGIVLMVLLYIGYIWYTTPTEEDRLAVMTMGMVPTCSGLLG